MSQKVVVVGSGASGVQFAQGLLRKGYHVCMLDAGKEHEDHPHPASTFNGLKEKLADPAEYLLGRNYEALVLPSATAAYYTFPPSKRFVFELPETFGYRATGFSPLISFAAGGLAEAWTGGSYPFNDEDLSFFPFSYKDLEPYYTEVANRIGVSGTTEDDLASFFPAHGGLQPPLRLDEHSRLLLDAYSRHKEKLNSGHQCFVGRSRVAALSQNRNGRCACTYCGRCQWGCPSGALYTPSIGLSECRAHPHFEYIPAVYVDHFRFNSGGRITHVVASDLNRRGLRQIEAETLVLAAGTLSTSNIFLRSIYLDSGEQIALPGLMDNRQILMPFLNLRMIGKRYDPDTYQYHQIAMGFPGERPQDYLHGLVTTLKTAIVHPVIQTLPFDMATSVKVFRNIHGALGLVNINFSDSRRNGNFVALDVDEQTKETRLLVHYEPEAEEPSRMGQATKRFRRALLKLGCIAPPSMTRPRPMGASVHYAGTIPMRTTHAKFSCSTDCRSYDFENLFFADGTSFPDLPAKNVTFTLMANAARIADQAF